MTGRSLAEFLQDILDTMAEIENFTTGVEFEAFQANREKILTAVRLVVMNGAR